MKTLYVIIFAAFSIGCASRIPLELESRKEYWRSEVESNIPVGTSIEKARWWTEINLTGSRCRSRDRPAGVILGSIEGGGIFYSEWLILLTFLFSEQGILESSMIDHARVYCQRPTDVIIIN